jgi:hypothetical protein
MSNKANEKKPMPNMEDRIKQAIQDAEQYGIATIPDVYRLVSGYLSRSLFNQILLDMFRSREIDLQLHYSPSEQEKREGIPHKRHSDPNLGKAYWYFVSVR